MPLSTDDFARLGLTAADALASKGTPLVESVDKLASANDMNLEQIKRLCEASNNAAFKALFDKTASDDREVVFDVAKAEDVISRRRGGAEKNASAPFDLSHELSPLTPTLGRGVEKNASAPKPFVDPLEERAREKTAAAAALAQQGAASRMREHLESVEESERFKYASAIDVIVRHFCGMPGDEALIELTEVEKCASAELSDLGVVVFTEVRRRLGMPAIETDLLTKCAFHPGKLHSSPISLHIQGAASSFERARSARIVLDTPNCIDAAIAAANAPAA